MGKKSKKGETPKPSKQEVALANVAEKKFSQYKKLYRPLAKKNLARTKATKGRIRENQGIVNADIQQGATGRDAGILQASLFGRGPQAGSSNRSIFSRGASEKGLGVARGAGMALARAGTETRGKEGKLRHIALGHGIARDSMQSQATLASNATSRAIQQSRIDLEKSNQLATTLGQGFGAFMGMGGKTPSGGGGGTMPSGLGSGGTFGYSTNPNGYVGGF